MIIDSNDYIETSIEKYLEQMLHLTSGKLISLQFRPLIIQVLSNTFLQMTGFLEKKMDMISWHIAHDDFEYRNTLIRDNNPITATVSNINKIYKRLLETNDKNISIMNNTNSKQAAYNTILKLFEDTNFINYTNSEFVAFKNICKKKFNQGELETLFKTTIEHRHVIAHNITSVYENYLSISRLNDIETMQVNWYARFMILVFIDNILINEFKKYQERHFKIKL